MKLLILWVLFISTLGCSSQKIETPNSHNDSTKINDITNSSDSDTLFITEKCGVSIWPNEKWVKQQQKKLSEDEWNTILDDGVYYLYEAEQFIEKKGIKNIYPKQKYLDFELQNGKHIVLDKDEIGLQSWRIILFNQVDNPKVCFPIDIETDFDQYFKDISY